MRKSELAELARFGVRHKVTIIEAQLRALYRAFPDEFVGEPSLLKPALKANGNDWPEFTATSSSGHGAAAAAAVAKRWTPERRAAQAERMRKRFARGENPNPRVTKGKATAKARARAQKHLDAKPWGTFVWQRAHDYLATQPARTADAKDICQHAKISSTATLITAAVDQHRDLFARVRPGVYRLKKVISHEAQSGSPKP